MSWIDDLKVNDSVAVRLGQGITSRLYVGKVTKVTKTKIIVNYIKPEYSSSFSKKNGYAPRRSVWDTPDKILELTPEIQEKLDFQTHCNILRRKINQISTAIDKNELTNEQMKSLISMISQWKINSDIK